MFSSVMNFLKIEVCFQQLFLIEKNFEKVTKGEAGDTIGSSWKMQKILKEKEIATGSVTNEHKKKAINWREVKTKEANVHKFSTWTFNKRLDMLIVERYVVNKNIFFLNKINKNILKLAQWK